MTFKENARLDTSQVRGGGGGGRRGGGGGLAAGGGIGGIILLVLYMLFSGGGGLGGGGSTASGSPWNFSAGDVSGSGEEGASGDFSHCQTGADANENLDCRVVGTVNSVQAFWESAWSQYEPAQTVIFSGTVQTGCGAANSQVGPFYCPLDQGIYIDVSFFDQLDQMGADGGSLSQMYVVAHEYGHHVQNLNGVLGRAQQDPQGPESGAVRVELQADCYAGVWVAHADGTRLGQEDAAILEPVTQDQIRSALSAAEAVGDDRIQEQMQGRVTPENWTHGSSEQRQKWFLTGYETGDPNACNTFSAEDLG
ncbi:KPN_02809 family neutral zinc metallopeptidase [Ornithinimicrobium cryptoxanthini]|uniref:Neutral zinc metallopeptidase n=1 Tax=Ornithinimicrobium cryptoxanthini TaxID=2934161 RepID=A0ABY4YDU5_9MICO|nr:neutral zinc metallopeptidase [Ornithinimicrobium cryptoxanthini]USQ74904.1 neutral zinc metallopeptidase [Ornithinimicrobium cryptoxanthini]